MIIQTDPTQSSETGDTYAVVAPSSNPIADSTYRARNSGEFSHEARLSTMPVLPDPKICQAKAAGILDFVDCLVRHPVNCLHALSFADRVFCVHPQRMEIVMRTATHVPQGGGDNQPGVQELAGEARTTD